MIEIREEQPADVAAIHDVNTRAFGQNLEGDIVDARFGFRPASTCGIVCEWDVPDDVFMVLVMDPEKMRGVTGLARYRPEFSNVS